MSDMFEGIKAGLEDAIAWARGDETRGRIVRGGFMVEGGVYEDTNFSTLVPGSQESYGPFDNYEEAYKVWSGKARSQIDICCHRLTIKEL